MGVPFLILVVWGLYKPASPLAAAEDLPKAGMENIFKQINYQYGSSPRQGPHYGPKHTMILIMATHKKVPLILGTPPFTAIMVICFLGFVRKLQEADRMLYCDARRKK